jgi:hypothetical protein
MLKITNYYKFTGKNPQITIKQLSKTTGKRKFHNIIRIIQNDSEQITTKSGIANELVAQSTKTSSNEN